MKLLIVLSLFLVVGCVSKDKPVERIITQTEKEYVKTPDELLVCPLPPMIDPEAIVTEEEYNREFVLELYANNIDCYESVYEIRKRNMEIDLLNSQ